MGDWNTESENVCHGNWNTESENVGPGNWDTESENVAMVIGTLNQKMLVVGAMVIGGTESENVALVIGESENVAW